MSQNGKEKIPESVTSGSVKSTLVSFIIAMVYGVVGAVGFASGREMLQIIVTSMTTGLIVNAGNAGGYHNLAAIIAIVVMAILWLSTFMIVWYKAEHAQDMGTRVKIGVKWILGAVVFIVITSVVVLAMTGSWPSLAGGV